MRSLTGFCIGIRLAEHCRLYGLLPSGVTTCGISGIPERLIESGGVASVSAKVLPWEVVMDNQELQTSVAKMAELRGE
jgi:hypothetical protein